LTKSTYSFVSKVRNSLAVCFITFSFLFLIPSAYGDATLPEVTTIVTNGGDDVSYRIPLTVSVVYDGVTYENVYATTNSVITFGRPDGTYWTYPTTPSISIESKDWWVLPQQMPDTHFILNVSEGGFQVDGAYRPYGIFTGDTTSIIITAQIQTDGTVAYSYAVDGPLSGNERTGAVLTDGTVVPLAEVNIIEVEEAPVLEPTPVEPIPTPTPDSETPLVPDTSPLPEPVPTPNPEPLPAPLPEVVPFYPPLPDSPIPPEDIPEPDIIDPPIVEPENDSPITPIPEPEIEPETEPIVTPEPEEVQESETEVTPEPEVAPEEETVTLDNGVVLTQEQAVAIALLQDPVALLQELFIDPGAALAALGQVGADMSPEAREESEKIVLSAIIASGIATQAAAGAAATATYRRKP
jgi:hypothetical protein